MVFADRVTEQLDYPAITNIISQLLRSLFHGGGSLLGSDPYWPVTWHRAGAWLASCHALRNKIVPSLLERLSQLFDNIPISSTILGCSCSRLHLSEILRWILSALRELCRRRSSFDISCEIPA